MRNLAASSRFAAEVETTRARIQTAVVLARQYTRDKDGKFSSGGGGGGVRDSLAAASTIEELNAALADEIKQVSGNDTHVDFAGSDLEVAKELGEGVVRGLEHSPSTRLIDVTTYGPGGGRAARDGEGGTEYANARTADDANKTTEIGFNVSYLSDPARFRASLAEDAKTGPDGVRGSASSDAGPMGVAIHEFGHVASSQVPWTHEKTVENVRTGEVIRRYTVDVEFEAGHHIGRIVEAQTGNPYGTNNDNSPRAFVSREISAYASWERGETTAEAFADVVLHGDSATQLSHDIYAMVTRGAGEAE